ncbi:hypothetical protein BJ742DRAFT_897617 [Cladochytrium replicatum]|nr:hypothetical protein BJ742DRAFT_897617 [Cladochytrium replicatum]
MLASLYVVTLWYFAVASLAVGSFASAGQRILDNKRIPDHTTLSSPAETPVSLEDILVDSDRQHHLHRRASGQTDSNSPAGGTEFLSLGWGINPTGAGYLPPCLKVVTKKATSTQAGSLKLYAGMSLSDARKVLGISASVQLGPTFSGSFRYAFTTFLYLPTQGEEIDLAKSRTLTKYGSRYYGSNEFTEKCGDRVIFSRDIGAVAAITYRINYQSLEDKIDIGASLAGKFQVVDVAAAVQFAVSNRDISLSASVTAFQFGGDVIKINQAIDGSAFSQCDGQNATACRLVYEAAVNFFTSDAFRTGILTKPVPLKYFALPYTKVVNLISNGLQSEIDAARARIDEIADKTAVTQASLKAFLFSTLSASRKDRINAVISNVTSNNALVNEVIDACYTFLQPFDTNSVEKCTTAASDLEQKAYFPPDTFFGAGLIFQAFTDAVETRGIDSRQAIGLPSKISGTTWTTSGIGINADSLPFRWGFKDGQALYYNPQTDSIYSVSDELEVEYSKILANENGGLEGGLPVLDAVTRVDRQGRSLTVQRFELRDGSSRVVTLSILILVKDDKDEPFRRVSGVCAWIYFFWDDVAGELGLPTLNPVTTQVNDETVTFCEFDNGIIIAPGSSSSSLDSVKPLNDQSGFVLYGPVYQYYMSKEQGGLLGRLGLPRSSVQKFGQLSSAKFEFGSIVHDAATNSIRIVQGTLADFLALEAYVGTTVDSKPNIQVRTQPSSQIELGRYGELVLRVTPPSALGIASFILSGVMLQQWDSKREIVGTPIYLYTTNSTYSLLLCERGTIVRTDSDIFSLSGYVQQYWMDEGGIDGPMGFPSSRIKETLSNGIRETFSFNSKFGYSLVLENGDTTKPYLKVCRLAIATGTTTNLVCPPINAITHPVAAHMLRIQRQAIASDVATLERGQMMVAFWGDRPAVLWRDLDETAYVWMLDGTNTVQRIEGKTSSQSSSSSQSPIISLRRFFRTSFVSTDADVFNYRHNFSIVLQSNYRVPSTQGTFSLQYLTDSRVKNPRVVPRLQVMVQKAFDFAFFFDGYGFLFYLFYGPFVTDPEAFNRMSKRDYTSVSAPTAPFNMTTYRQSRPESGFDGRTDITLDQMIAFGPMTPIPQGLLLYGEAEAGAKQLTDGEATFWIDSATHAPKISWQTGETSNVANL